ncbi:unnamed protein product [Cuscuta epithymum]|uniref:Uncharacterized protein n=1 Tax=Cuscuta epithymum TaxID=186058 RepID=A0AAV0FWX8_9ASTE|nr:unnamed protein product [Cuscuta epithymum]
MEGQLQIVHRILEALAARFHQRVPRRRRKALHRREDGAAHALDFGGVFDGGLDGSLGRVPEASSSGNHTGAELLVGSGVAVIAVRSGQIGGVGEEEEEESSGNSEGQLL